VVSEGVVEEMKLRISFIDMKFVKVKCEVESKYDRSCAPSQRRFRCSHSDSFAGPCHVRWGDVEASDDIMNRESF
jgi:hypothetical protein